MRLASPSAAAGSFVVIATLVIYLVVLAAQGEPDLRGVTVFVALFALLGVAAGVGALLLLCAAISAGRRAP